MKVKSTRCCPFLFVNRGQPPLGWKGGEGSEGREAEGVPVSQLDPGTRELEARARELEVLASPAPPKLPKKCPGASELLAGPLGGRDREGKPWRRLSRTVRGVLLPPDRVRLGTDRGWRPLIRPLISLAARQVRGGRVQCRVQCLSERGEFRPELDLFRGSPALTRPFGLSPRGPALPQSDPV